jgi:hypothetical protein
MNFSILDNPSAHKRNRYGDIGSPCRMPGVGENTSEKCPLTLTENFTVSTHLIINATKPSLKPGLVMTALR